MATTLSFRHGGEGSGLPEEVSDQHPFPVTVIGQIETVDADAELTLLESLSRTASISSEVQTNKTARGVMVILDVTTGAAAETLTLAIERYIWTSNTWEAITLFGATAAAFEGEKVYFVYPGAVETAAIADQEMAGIPLALGRWRVTVTHSGSTAWVYSVIASYCA